MWVPPSAACPLSLVCYCRVSGPVSRGRALDPLTGSNPHSFPPLPPDTLRSETHTLTRSEMASQDLFCHKVCFSFFPFHCHIPLLSMLWITGFHRLCSWAFPCCSPRFRFEHRLCFFFHYSGLCLLDVVLGFGCGDDGFGLCPWLLGFSLHVMGACHSQQDNHTNSTPSLLPKTMTFMK